MSSPVLEEVLGDVAASDVRPGNASVALVALTFVAFLVMAAGLSVCAVRLGGFTPVGQTIVAPVGAADRAPNAATAAEDASGVRATECESS